MSVSLLRTRPFRKDSSAERNKKEGDLVAPPLLFTRHVRTTCQRVQWLQIRCHCTLPSDSMPRSPGIQRRQDVPVLFSRRSRRYDLRMLFEPRRTGFRTKKLLRCSARRWPARGGCRDMPTCGWPGSAPRHLVDALRAAGLIVAPAHAVSDRTREEDRPAVSVAPASASSSAPRAEGGGMLNV